MKHFILFNAWFRLLLGFCPKCNSDAPEFWECDVCQGYDNGRSRPYPPSKILQKEWWSRYKKGGQR